MKWKIAAAALTAAAIVSAPLAGAKPATNGNGNGNKPTTPPGRTISVIAKSGGGAAGVLGALVQLKPTNPGLPKALQNATRTKTTSPTTSGTSTPSPTTSGTPAPTTTNTPSPTTDTPSPSPTTDTSAPTTLPTTVEVTPTP